MPDEVFELWLDGRIRANGWPPVTSEWQGALRDQPLSFWQALEWTKDPVDLDYDSLTPKAQRIVDGLIDANFYGATNAYSSLVDSKQRMNEILEFMKVQGTLPGTLIFFEDDGSLEIIDGSHRLAVFFELMRRSAAGSGVFPHQVAWVGRVAGEV